ncbi:MAG TPA: type II secretion system protein [Polyangia bacterium]|jgi:prepilin-type N-terminal cleavage/methylation domain-containing protein
MTARQVARQRGFSLTELMVVVVIMGVLASVAVFAGRRANNETQVDKAVANFRWALNAARGRAVATHATYLIEVSPTTGFRYCTMGLPQGSPPACGTGTAEVAPWTGVGDRVVLAGYATATLMGAGASQSLTATVRILAKPDGSIDGDPATTGPDGFTLYLKTSDDAKFRKVWVFALTAQSHYSDHW